MTGLKETTQKSSQKLKNNITQSQTLLVETDSVKSEC
jgi:uncharacterized protein YbaP (TraB family)